MTNFKKFLYILSWIPVILLHIPLLLLGLIMVPIGLFYSWPKLCWLWYNDEEGCPDWWFDTAKMKGGFIGMFPRFWWYAVRNPVNNFRFIFKDRKANISGNWTEGRMEAQDLIDRRMKVAYQWKWSGPFAGYRRVWLRYYGMSAVTYSEFWIGWKIGSTVPGMGFTLQYRRNRKIGT